MGKPKAMAHPESRQHPGEAARVLAALAAMVFWAVGVSLMDARFGLGAFLCVVTIVWTVWLYWSDLLTIPSRSWRQAKRYTNLVDVSAVRDLWGTS
jgi:hypothetical protein